MDSAPPVAAGAVRMTPPAADGKPRRCTGRLVWMPRWKPSIATLRISAASGAADHGAGAGGAPAGK